MVFDVRSLQAGARVEEFTRAMMLLRILRLVVVLTAIQMVLSALVARISAPAPVTLRWHLFYRIIQVRVCKHGRFPCVNVLLLLVVILG